MTLNKIESIYAYALTIPCKRVRTRFLMELGKKYRGLVLDNYLNVSDMDNILNSIN